MVKQKAIDMNATNKNAIKLCLPSFKITFLSWKVERTVAIANQTPKNSQYPIGMFPDSTYKIDAVSLLTVIINIAVPEITTGSNSKPNKIGFRETPPPKPAAEAIIPTAGARRLAVTTLLIVHLLSLAWNFHWQFSLRNSSFLAILEPIKAIPATARAYIPKTVQSPPEHFFSPAIESAPLEPCNRAQIIVKKPTNQTIKNLHFGIVIDSSLRIASLSRFMANSVGSRLPESSDLTDSSLGSTGFISIIFF